MLVLGMGCGGIATEYFGWRSALLVDATTYLASWWLVSRVRVHEGHVAKDRSERSKTLKELGEFFAYLAAEPHVRTVALVKCMYGVSGAYGILLTMFGESVYRVGNGGTLGTSVLFVARGVGIFLGPFIARAVTKGLRSRMRQAILVALLLSAVAYTGLAATSELSAAALCVIAAHMGLSVVYLFSTVLLQLEADPRFRGRIFGFDLGMATLTNSLATLAYGGLMELGLLTPRGAAVGVGVTLLLPAYLWQKSQKYWHGRAH